MTKLWSTNVKKHKIYKIFFILIQSSTNTVLLYRESKNLAFVNHYGFLMFVDH